MPRARPDCGNPLLRDWMAEWMEEARSMQTKSYFTYKKAYDSLCACPTPFNHPSESQQLNGIGSTLAGRLEKKMIDYCEGNGLPLPTRTKGKRRNNGISTPDSNSDSSSNKRQKRAPRPYIPKFRTGGYAILLTLLDFRDNGQVAATKEQIIRCGQKYCDASLDLPEPGTNYTAWSSIKTLKEKGYIWQSGSPARFSLTDSGETMALQLRSAGDGNSSSGRQLAQQPQSSRSAPPRSRNDSSNNNDDDEDYDNSDTEEPDIDLSLYVLDPSTYGRDKTASSSTSLTTSTLQCNDNINTNDEGDSESDIDLSLYVLNPEKCRNEKSFTGTTSEQSDIQVQSDNTLGLESRVYSDPSSSFQTNNDIITDTCDIITLLSPSPPPSFTRTSMLSSSLRNNEDKSFSSDEVDVFEYTYLDTSDQPVRHVSQAAVDFNERYACLMYKIQFSSRQIQHAKVKELNRVDQVKCTAYMLERHADVVCPGLPARPLLPLHQERYETGQRPDFWPDCTSVPSSQQQQQVGSYQDSQEDCQTISSQARCSRPDVVDDSSRSEVSGTLLTERVDTSTVAALVCQEGNIWQSDDYSIVMVLDNREVKMKSNRDYIQDKLVEKGVNVVKRALDLGDVIWVAKHVSTEEEMFLDIVVERKRMDDLVTSVKDGRFHEQKYRLKQSGSRKVFYIVEEYSKESAVKFGAQAIQTAMSSVQVIDRFYLKRTGSIDDTIDYLVCLTKMIQKLYQGSQLQEIPTQYINRSNYLAVRNELNLITLNSPKQLQVSPRYHVIPYSIYNEINSKSRSSTLQDLYVKMLMTVRGVNAEKANSLIRCYPTPYHLLKAMDTANNNENSDEGKQLAMLATKDRISRRKWALSLSERLWDIWGKKTT